MTNELQPGNEEVDGMEPFYHPTKPRARNLGGAILLAAIEDYRSLDEDMHENAKRFLYPKTKVWRDQYEWVVALAEDLNPAWLRGALDRAKGKWDRQRRARIRVRPRKNRVMTIDGKENAYVG